MMPESPSATPPSLPRALSVNQPKGGAGLTDRQPRASASRRAREQSSRALARHTRSWRPGCASFSATRSAATGRGIDTPRLPGRVGFAVALRRVWLTAAAAVFRHSDGTSCETLISGHGF